MIHVHDCKCVYVHSTDTVTSQAVQPELHNHTPLLIRPYQPCDTGESQLSAGSFPSELPPSPSESVISLLLEQLVKSSMYHVHTLHIHVHTVYIHAHTLYMGTTDYLRTSIPLQCMPVCTAHVRCMYYAIIH
jgi:hypothetical protein